MARLVFGAVGSMTLGVTLAYAWGRIADRRRYRSVRKFRNLRLTLGRLTKS